VPAIEEVCKVLGDAVKGDQIPNLIAPLKVNGEPGTEQGTKWKRLFNAVIARQNKSQDGKGLVRLVMEVMRPVRFDSSAEFEATRALVNARLLLSGFEVREDGVVVIAKAARTVGEAQQRADDLRADLARRDVHPDVLAFCRAEPLQQNYFHAVLEASKSVADKLRTLSGVTSGSAFDGTRLVYHVLPGGQPAGPVQCPGHRVGALGADRDRDLDEGAVQRLPQPGRPRAQGGLGHLAQRRPGHAHPRVHAAPPPRQCRRQADGALTFPRMAPAWAGVRAAGSAVSLSSPVMITVPRKLNSKPKDRATRVAAWLTGFPAAAPSSSSQASQRLVTWIRSAHRVPMSVLSERMNRVPPGPGRSTSLGGPSTGMSRAFTYCAPGLRSCACLCSGG
jgi:Protein of unknown function (Hypoth_ymh)